MNKTPSKSPHIVIFQTDKESDRLVIETLRHHFHSITVVAQLKELCKQLVEATPKVVLVTGETMAATLATYYRCYDAVKDFKTCEHRFVSLIPRQCESEAYQAFRAGLIDDYMVARPVYEIHRIVLICEHLLIELGIPSQFESKKQAFQQHAEKYSEELQLTLRKSIERKESMREAFEQSISEIDKSLDLAARKIMQDQPIELDLALLKKTLAAIKSDEIRPELLQLQQKAVSLLSAVVTPPTEKAQTHEPSPGDTPQTNTGDETQAPAAPPKPKQPVVFNRLYNQDVDPDEILKKEPKPPALLLVEDDQISLQLTTRLLKSYKIKVDIANNGRMAYASLTTKKYDLVLMDINLPDTNGIYLVDQITSSDGLNSDTPVIMLSGNKNKAIVTNAIERGAKGYIVKPLYKDSIVKLFDKYKLPLKGKG